MKFWFELEVTIVIYFSVTFAMAGRCYLMSVYVE